MTFDLISAAIGAALWLGGQLLQKKGIIPGGRMEGSTPSAPLDPSSVPRKLWWAPGLLQAIRNIIEDAIANRPERKAPPAKPVVEALADGSFRVVPPNTREGPMAPTAATGGGAQLAPPPPGFVWALVPSSHATPPASAAPAPPAALSKPPAPQPQPGNPQPGK
jgi:hypothetical protein